MLDSRHMGQYLTISSARLLGKWPEIRGFSDMIVNRFPSDFELPASEV